MRIPPPVPVHARDVQTLSEWASGDRFGAAAARRARIVLLSRTGLGPSAIAAELGCSKQTVITWRERYRAEGLSGLQDAPRSGRPATVDVAAVVRRTLESPGSESVRWSTRRLAAEFGISNVAVANIWRTWGIVPGPGGRVLLATEPAVEQPVSGVAGLYLDPQVRVLAVLVEAGDREQHAVRTVPVSQRPGLGSRFAALIADAGNPSTDGVLIEFLQLLAATWARRGAGSGATAAGERRLALLVDGLDGLPGADTRPGVVAHRVPAGLAWERVVRVACLVAGATQAGAGSVSRLRRAVAEHPAGGSFSWVNTTATHAQEGRPLACGVETSFTVQHHPIGSATAAEARNSRISRSFSQ